MNYIYSWLVWSSGSSDGHASLSFNVISSAELTNPSFSKCSEQTPAQLAAISFSFRPNVIIHCLFSISHLGKLQQIFQLKLFASSERTKIIYRWTDISGLLGVCSFKQLGTTQCSTAAFNSLKQGAHFSTNAGRNIMPAGHSLY